MSKSTYPTKYQLEHLKKRINSEIDPLIDQAELSVKSIVADLTESAELKLAKKIKADVVIKELEQAIENLEIKQRKAQTFFGKIKDPELKGQLNYKFDKKDYLSERIQAEQVDVSSTPWVLQDVYKSSFNEKNPIERVNTLNFNSSFNKEKLNTIYSNLDTISFYKLITEKNDLIKNVGNCICY